MKKLILLFILISGIFTAFAFISPDNAQCIATAKSTGNRCKNKVWGDCNRGNYCYNHCK